MPTGQPPDWLELPLAAVSWLDLGLGFGLILIAVGVSRWHGASLGRQLLWGAARTVVQLVLVGYVLVYLFNLDQWYLVLAALGVMVGVAAATAARRQERPDARLHGLMGLAILVGSALTLVYVGALVVSVDPWYNPRYLIPLFGMIVGNAMNGAALAAERLAGEIATRRAEVEAYLSLGASPPRAAREPTRRALRAALIPTVNNLMVVGIVALPGMMTGQILSGESPLLAVRYQIVVMFMLASAVAVTSALATLWYRRRFFTAAEQLVEPPAAD